MEKIVYIKWKDASTTYGWQYKDKDGPVVIHTVGFEVEKNKDFIVITSSYSPSKVLDQLTIPKLGIVKYKVISEK